MAIQWRCHQTRQCRRFLWRQESRANLQRLCHAAGEGRMTEISDAETGKTTVIVNDARGRQLEVRKLKPLDRLRLVETIGADNALNQPYLGYATLAASVTAIDGKPVPRISSKLALEALVQQ